ncbi:MAG TPA: NYN domain-containing protein [Candidatus Saccharimonadales bacterium]|nr:NYN domain-containing protein [Candidatus Saccharimonadales bacterium]
MDKNPRLNAYAFIDSQNLNVGVQKFGWKMDWVKFRKFLQDKYNVTTAYMFIGYVPEFENMYKQLHEAGYMIVLKPTYDMTRPRPEQEKSETGNTKSEESGKKVEEEKKPVKGNVDADLVLWVMKQMPQYDKAVIVSGDGDFYSLVEYLDEQNKLLKLLAPNAHYSGLFNRYEKYIERLDKFRGELAYHDHRKRTKK